MPSAIAGNDANTTNCVTTAPTVTIDSGQRRTARYPHTRSTAGWRQACDELQLESTPDVDVVLPDRQSGEFSAGVDAVLDAAVAAGVTGLLVHSDREAMAVVDLALNRRLGVPGDLSVIAYDDEVAELFTPALTAVSPPREAVGRAAVDLIVERLAEPERPVRRVLVSPRLVERATTAAAPH